MRILTNKEIYAGVKKPTIIETIRLYRLRWFGHEQRMEENRIPKRVLYMNLGTTRLRVRPRNRWQNEVREDGRLVGGEGWQEKVHNTEMEEAPENVKESSHSAHANGVNEIEDYILHQILKLEVTSLKFKYKMQAVTAPCMKG